jgi:hypothetical protein
MTDQPMPTRRSSTPSYYLGRPNTTYLRRFAKRTLLDQPVHESGGCR